MANACWQKGHISLASAFVVTLCLIPTVVTTTTTSATTAATTATTALPTTALPTTAATTVATAAPASYGCFYTTVNTDLGVCAGLLSTEAKDYWTCAGDQSAANALSASRSLYNVSDSELRSQYQRLCSLSGGGLRSSVPTDYLCRLSVDAITNARGFCNPEVCVSDGPWADRPLCCESCATMYETLCEGGNALRACAKEGCATRRCIKFASTAQQCYKAVANVNTGTCQSLGSVTYDVCTTSQEKADTVADAAAASMTAVFDSYILRQGNAFCGAGGTGSVLIGNTTKEKTALCELQSAASVRSEPCFSKRCREGQSETRPVCCSSCEKEHQSLCTFVGPSAASTACDAIGCSRSSVKGWCYNVRGDPGTTGDIDPPTPTPPSNSTDGGAAAALDVSGLTRLCWTLAVCLVLTLVSL